MGNTGNKTIAIKHDEFDQVRFTDNDGHVFFIGLGTAIKHCKRVTEAKADVDADAVELLVIVENWMKRNGHKLGNMAIRAESGWLHFYMSSTLGVFDVALSDMLAEFESETIQKLSFLKVDTRQVSAAELEELRSLAEKLGDAQPDTAHQPVEAQ